MPERSSRANANRVELTWAGKRTHVERIALPLERIESVDAPRGGDLFSLGPQLDGGWRNKLIWGDNKLVMSSLRLAAYRPMRMAIMPWLRRGPSSGGPAETPCLPCWAWPCW